MEEQVIQEQIMDQVVVEVLLLLEEQVQLVLVGQEEQVVQVEQVVMKVVMVLYQK
jgi:hypothetical protein